MGSEERSSVAPTMNVYGDYGWLRGFSVVPSWSARIETAWLNYDAARMREEIAPARLFHANCIRLWIEYTAWSEDPELVTANFLDAVAAIDEAGMKVMPCLFNRWHDTQADYGGTYIENILYQTWATDGRDVGNRAHHQRYVRALVEPLANDERVLIWDLCNEPRIGPVYDPSAGVTLSDEQAALEHEWLSVIADTVRKAGARQPITIGTRARVENIEPYADLCDVLCGHPYAWDEAGLRKLIEEYASLSVKHGKAFLVNETIPGGEDGKPRGDIAEMYARLLSEAGFGWMGWALREGKAVSTRRDLCDQNGLDGFGFHPFVGADGKPRPGLEALLEPPVRRAPWLK